MKPCTTNCIIYSSTDPKCKIPGSVANTILKTTAATGYFFEYECSSGYGLASGNLYRACRMDGTLSEKAPVCAFVYYRFSKKVLTSEIYHLKVTDGIPSDQVH